MGHPYSTRLRVKSLLEIALKVGAAEKSGAVQFAPPARHGSVQRVLARSPGQKKEDATGVLKHQRLRVGLVIVMHPTDQRLQVTPRAAGHRRDSTPLLGQGSTCVSNCWEQLAQMAGCDDTEPSFSTVTVPEDAPMTVNL